MSVRTARRLSYLGASLAVLIGLVLPAGASAYVYWSSDNTNAIGRANLDGSQANQGFITGVSSSFALAVDGSDVYWANFSSGTIGRANLDGSAVSPGFITGAKEPAAVAVDGSHVYWANFHDGTIGRANLDGSAVNQSFITGAGDPSGLAVDGFHIFWTNQKANTIGRANLDGSAVNQSFITGAGSPGGLAVSQPTGVAVNGSRIYWTNESHGTIDFANLNGSGIVPRPPITGADSPGGIALDGSHLYWANLNGTIGRASLAGTGVDQSFITGARAPEGVAVDRFPNATSTALSCDPAATQPPTPTSCTATVGDTSASPRTPAGTVSFTTTGGGAFSPPAKCTLTASGASSSSCELSYKPSAGGFETLTAAYAGEATHAASSGTTTFSTGAHLTSTALTCAPGTLAVAGSTTCTARVTDTSTGGTAPSGSVAFTTSGGGTFASAASCSLTAAGASDATCKISYAPSAPGRQTLTATYGGEKTHAPSNRATTITAKKPSNKFKLGKPKLDHADGTAKLPVKVPDAGTVRIRGVGIHTESAKATRRTTLELEIKGKHKTIRRLDRTHHARIKARVTFKPVGGSARTEKKALTLKLAGSG